MRNSLQIWASLFLFSPIPFSLSNSWFFLRQRLCPILAINWLLLQVHKFAIFPEKFTHPYPLQHSLSYPFFLGRYIEWAARLKSKEAPSVTKNVQISHLVVFMLQAPCGPWRCWKHGKHWRDQSNLISIRSELEWPGCMARPSSLLGSRRLSQLLYPPPLCAFVFFQDFFFVMSGCFSRWDVANRIMGKWIDQNKSEITQWNTVKSYYCPISKWKSTGSFEEDSSNKSG